MSPFDVSSLLARRAAHVPREPDAPGVGFGEFGDDFESAMWSTVSGLGDRDQ